MMGAYSVVRRLRLPVKRNYPITKEIVMVHAYHVILPMYGFWLPNDPRGSWSDFVASWELARFGETTRHLEQRTFAQLTDE